MRAAGRLRGDPPTEITARQREVLELLWHGLSRREAGARLGISEHTVRNHIREAFARLGVSRLVDAFRAAGLAFDDEPLTPALRARQAADALGLSVNALKRIPAEQLPFFRVVRRGDRRYRREDLAAYIAGRSEG